MTHAPVVGVWARFRCDLAFPLWKDWHPLPPPVLVSLQAEDRQAGSLGDLRVTVRASPPGTPPRTSYSSRNEHPVRFPGDLAGLSHGAPSISFGVPSVDRMSIAASGDGLTSSEDEGAVGLPPSGVVATAALDPELTAMLARAAVSIGLEVNRRPSPEPSRLDDWFLGAGRGSQPCPAPVPFFPEVHEELTKSWMATFTARSPSSASSILTTLDGEVARGYAGIPQVERAIAVHLCPRNAATWRNRPRLPSKSCKLTVALAAKAYSTAGQAASALHAMAILQVHQAKALKQVHEGSNDLGQMQELRTATDFALRATKVTARSLWKAMSTMVVQERHLWLNLVEMKDVDKAYFLDAPISQAGLFGDTVEGFAQQFSAVQQQTEAIQHTCPGVMHHPPLPPGPGLSLPVTVCALLCPPELLCPRPNRYLGRRVEPLAGERHPPRPSQAPSRPVSRRSGPDVGNPERLEFALSQETARTAPLLPLVEGREENLTFLFWHWPFCLRSKVGHGSTGSSLSGSPCFPCVHEGRRRRPYPVTGGGRQDPQLPRRLAYPSPIQRAVGRSQGLGALAPQPFGASGQLGKVQALPCAENLFSRCGVRLCEYDGTPHGGTCPSSAELPEFLQRQECGTTCGIRSCSPDLAFLRAGVPLEQVSRHTVVTKDASSTGWGATCNGQAASGLWTGHINSLELWAVNLALRQFQPLLLGKHMLVRTDNTAAVSYINRLGGIQSHRMSQPARHLLLWSPTQFESLRAVHIPGKLNRAADALSRQLSFPGVAIPRRSGWSGVEAQVDLFASPESSHCQLYFSLTEGPLGTDALAQSWPRALRKYAFPPVSLLAQTLCKLREDEEQVLLVAPHWPTQTWFPELISLTTAPPLRIPLRKELLSQGLGTIWHPRPDLWNLHVWLLDGTRQTWVVYHRQW